MRTARSNRPSGLKVAVIGAGFGGIAAAVELQKSGITDFVVHERSAGPGGVWWDNRYPGAEVDTPSHMYSFSFKRFDWSRSHAQQAELQRYMQETIDQYQLGDHFRYGSEVHEIRWDDRRSVHQLTFSDGTVSEVDVVISAVGMLNVPRMPTWPGLEEFEGVCLHTAHWDPDLDLTGKRVAVVGTGSTSAQIVPTVAPHVKQLYLYQREPGWIGPKPVEEFSAEQRAVLQGRWRYRYQRFQGYLQASATREGGDIHIEGSRSNVAAMEEHVAYINESFATRPELVESLTPQYGFFGKRPIKDSNFYPALLRDNVELVPHPVERVTRTGIVDHSGRERQVDVVIMATGFQPANYLARLKVYGRDGQELHDVWAGEPQAYLGITMPGFPNFFMLYGPNTNSPVIVFFLELQAQFARRCIVWMRRRRGRSVELRRGVLDRYDRWLQKQMEGSVWTSSNNYFRTASGRVVTQWPVSPTKYWLLAKLTPLLTSKVKK